MFSGIAIDLFAQLKSGFARPAHRVAGALQGAPAHQRCRPFRLLSQDVAHAQRGGSPPTIPNLLAGGGEPLLCSP
jgi:hypothetical protein